MKKNIISAAIAAGMIFAASVPALAADQCVNEKTGAISLNTCRIRQEKRANVLNLNLGAVRQNVNSSTNTGANTSAFNTAASANDPIMTGNASNLVGSQVGLNKSATAVGQSSDAKEVIAGNTITGYNSTNRVSVNNNKTANVLNVNAGLVSHEVNSSANTGGNSSTFNTVSGDILTGHASNDVLVVTELNTSTTSIVQ